MSEPSIATYEVEQKFRVAGFDAVEQALATSGAKQGSVVAQVDTYFAHPERDFAQTDEALRIRQIGDRSFVTYKGPKIDESSKTRQEIELAIGDINAGDKFREILLALGFTRVASVHKTRRTYHIARGAASVEAVLDDVQQVGTFVELEIADVPAGDLAAARECIDSLAVELSLGEPTRQSYLELLLASQ